MSFNPKMKEARRSVEADLSKLLDFLPVRDYGRGVVRVEVVELRGELEK